MSSYHKPPVNNNSCIGGEEQEAGTSKGHQSSRISEPFHREPGCRSLGEWHCLQQPQKGVSLNNPLRRPEDLPLNCPLGEPKEDAPLNPPLRRPREDLPLNSPLGQTKNVPLNAPPVLETTTPLELFQDAFAVLNDFCGNLCTKIPCGCQHEYPFYRRAVCNTDTDNLLMTFITVVRVTDDMASVVELFGCSRDDVVDFAKALIVALIEILEKLRHEAIPEEKTWRVELNDMVDFLMDPKNRDILTKAKRQIRCMHDTICQILNAIFL